MTLAPPENSGPDEAQRGADEPVIRPVVRQRAAQKRRHRRKLVGVQGALTALFVVALLGLAYAGWNSALRITGGERNEVSDPDAPGYVAAAKPTGVTLIAFTGEPVPTPTTSTRPDPAVPGTEAQLRRRTRPCRPRAPSRHSPRRCW